MGRKVRVLVRGGHGLEATHMLQILMTNYFWLNQLLLVIGKDQEKVIRWERAGIYIYMYVRAFCC